VLGLAVLAFVLFVLGRRAARWVPRRVVLELDLERGVVERAKRTFPGGGESRPLVLRDVVDALARASEDRRVVGLLARIGSFSPGLAVAQELREAVVAFRASGKRAAAWAETLGEGQAATVETYLASAFDEVIVQPTGEVGLTGVLVEQPFAREALDKLGVDPQIDHRHEYKTAKYMFTERSMPEPQRESVQALMDSQVEQLVAGIAEGRGLDADAVRALFDRGPFTAEEAKEAGLIDEVAYRDEVYEAVKTTLAGKLLNLEVYLRRAGRPHRKGATIALIQATGTIVRGKSRPPGLPGGARLGSDDVAAALRKAAASKRVKAIVLRVDSPGGSAVASDVILRAVKRAREQGTPVVVSMGNVAASGGYYVACGADEIVANAGTITGSIGVVYGKFVVQGLWRRLGVAWDSLQVGAQADFWSGRHAFDEAGWAKTQSLLDQVYADFTSRVAAGRALSPEAVEAVARGRVWTGTQALAHGLVDRLGGLEVAVGRARVAAGLAEDARVRVEVVPKPRRFAAWRMPESSEALAAVLSEAVRVGEAAGLLGAEGRLRMPPLLLNTDAR
jgi:protease-4